MPDCDIMVHGAADKEIVIGRIHRRILLVASYLIGRAGVAECRPVSNRLYSGANC